MEGILKGKPVAKKIKEDVKKQVQFLNSKGIKTKVKIVRLGEEGDDVAYEKAAVKAMIDCGIDYELLSLPRNISQDDFIANLQSVNHDEKVHGILLFRPLPEQIDENIVKYVISPEKDIDCFNPINIAKVMEGDESGFYPCTPEAIIEIIKYYNIVTRGKRAVIIGRSLIVGKPIAMMLLKEDATVTICHSKSEELEKISKKADILIVAIGRANMIDSDYIKKDTAVIDVGINVDQDGNIFGDVNTEDSLAKTKLITPVPNGVGSVTTAILAKHVVKAAQLANGGRKK